MIVVDRHGAQGSRVHHDDRLENVFEQRCDWIQEYGRPDLLAVDGDELSLTYNELDAWANRLARYLRLHGAGAGDRIALLFDRPADAYIGMLAVLKLGGAYVPLDLASPGDRSAYIVADARAKIVLSRSTLREPMARSQAAADAQLLFVDDAAPLIAELSDRRLQPAERGGHPSSTAFVVYHSDPNGRPAAVAIDHPSICNAVKVAAEVYGLRSRDRVYLDSSLSSNRAVEQLWATWASGATVVPDAARLRGQQLHEFLSRSQISAVYGTATQLADVPSVLPELKLVLLAGEPVPSDQVARWHGPGRRVLGTYSPATGVVAAAWAELHPDKPVSLGLPLPSFAAVILDPNNPRRALPHGEPGEIGIAGVGLACGYLNRDDLPEHAFVEDFLDVPGNPSKRIFRTGDLGRVNSSGEIEYLGRVDRPVRLAADELATPAVEDCERAAIDSELSAVRSELERLRAEKADLLEQLRGLRPAEPRRQVGLAPTAGDWAAAGNCLDESGTATTTPSRSVTPRPPAAATPRWAGA